MSFEQNFQYDSGDPLFAGLDHSLVLSPLSPPVETQYWSQDPATCFDDFLGDEMLPSMEGSQVQSEKSSVLPFEYPHKDFQLPKGQLPAFYTYARQERRQTKATYVNYMTPSGVPFYYDKKKRICKQGRALYDSITETNQEFVRPTSDLYIDFPKEYLNKQMVLQLLILNNNRQWTLVKDNIFEKLVQVKGKDEQKLPKQVLTGIAFTPKVNEVCFKALSEARNPIKGNEHIYQYHLQVVESGRAVRSAPFVFQSGSFYEGQPSSKTTRGGDHSPTNEQLTIEQKRLRSLRQVKDTMRGCSPIISMYEPARKFVRDNDEFALSGVL